MYTTAVSDNLVILAHWQQFHSHPQPFSPLILNYIHIKLGLIVQGKRHFEQAVEFHNSSGLEIISVVHVLSFVFSSFFEVGRACS